MCFSLLYRFNFYYSRTEENSNEEADETSSQNHNKTALIWGLSMSSSNLAKQLLPEAKLQLSESESIMTYTPSPPLVVASDRGVGSSRSDETNNGQGSSRKTDLSEVGGYWGVGFCYCFSVCIVEGGAAKWRHNNNYLQLFITLFWL